MEMLKRFDWTDTNTSLELYEDHVSFIYPKRKRDIGFDTVSSISFFEGNFFKNPTITFNGAGLIHTEYSVLAGLVTFKDGELTVSLKYKDALREFYEAANGQWKLYKQNTSISREQHNADQLMRWKELLDAGAITQEEYNIKKKQLLEI